MDLRSDPLSDAETRILGVLVEKQLATPQSYPLTENALLTGCNQTTNRFPVVDYDTSVVRPALIRLRERALTKRVRRVGERVEKHAHRLDEQLGLSSATPLAILAVLMLRGAQTPGELRSRTQRLDPDADATSFDAALTELQDRGLAEPLPRRPGEKQPRWRHLLGGTDTTAEPPAEPGRGATDVDAADRPRVPTLRELAELVARLQTRVTTLERELGVAPDEVAPDEVAPDEVAQEPGSDREGP
jgi:uncharacterized protein